MLLAKEYGSGSAYHRWFQQVG